MKNDRSDIFRFMAIREPDKIINVDAARIKACGERKDTSVLLTKFKEALKLDTSDKAIEKIATDYVNNKLSGATTYTIRLNELDSQLSKIDKEIHSKPVNGSVSFIKKELVRLDITDETLANWKNRLDDSFNAALVLRKERGSDLRGIERAIRILHIILQVKNGAISDDKSVADALTKTITVSRLILSKAPSPSKDIDNVKIKRNQENAERIKKAVEEYESNDTAINELTAAYDEDWEMRRLLQSEEVSPVTEEQEIPAVYSGLLQNAARWLGFLPISEKVIIPASKPPKNRTGFQSILSENITKNITQKTKERLDAIGSSSVKIEASLAVARLEEKNLDIANNFSHVSTGTGVVMFGGLTNDIRVPENIHAGQEKFYDYGLSVKYTPGACSVSATDAPIKQDKPPFNGKFNSLGVGELQVVKQKLIAYEIGEIAHIENVMASEKRSRNHRKLHRTEEFTSFELEREEETERDLETTTRFELQREINKEVQESTQKEAGISVTGSYGPTVEFSANAGIATDSSSSKSKSLSTSYSKEVVDRSVSRIQEKIKEKRTLLTIDEVEVINKHSFKNQDLEAIHINGIYRWVNKKYEAQVFNYGRRELIEVIIPEPAAFLRYMATNRPKDGSAISKPLKPGYCVRGNFVPLSVGTLTEKNYLDWVTAYNIQDIQVPPPKFVITSTAYDKDTFTISVEDPFSAVKKYKGYFAGFSDVTFKIPPGYQAKKAWLNLNMSSRYVYGEIAIGTNSVFVRHNNLLIGPGGFVNSQEGVKDIIMLADIQKIEITLNNEETILPVAMSLMYLGLFTATLEVECKRTKESLMEWKMSTFNAIMNRYEILKEEYEEAISGEERFGSVDIQGKNPIENQKIILNELKRQVITQMTGETFDSFDAMQKNVGEYGYPQQDVDEAWSEGQYIRFVEQAFEWENLQYLFYPYYWGKKKDWPINSQLEDADPLFKSFLQAGSCRLNIAVRPGFVEAVNTFLSTGELPWGSNGGATTIECLDTNGEEENVDPFLSITEEMQAQQGAVYFKSEGTVSYVAGDPEAQLTGDNTSFKDDDVNREINIAGVIYMIQAVNTEQQTIILDEDIGATLQGDVQYAIGAKAIGVPWVVTIPTSLVILGDGSGLPETSE